MESLLKTAERYGSRVVLVGDTQQLKAVEAGRPFAQLQARGMAVAGMSEIIRQKNPELKKAVELAAIGEIRKSVALMEKEVVQIPDNATRYARIAQDYVALPEQDRNNTLVVSGTNEARREINERIREGLGLKGRGVEVEVLAKKDLTQAELKRLESYRPGDFVKPDRSYKTLGLQKSELYKVVKVQKSGVTLERTDGSKINWDPIQKNKVNVYSPEKREITSGELLRVTQNDREKGLINGEKLKLLEIGEKGLKLEGQHGKIVELSTKKALHLEHGYCSTVHSAQGRTSDKVLIDANTRSLTSAQDNFYVAISRARHEAKIYTNDKEKLPEAMSRKMEKEAALELNRPIENRTFQPRMDLKSVGHTGIQKTMKEKTPERRLEFER